MRIDLMQKANALDRLLVFEMYAQSSINFDTCAFST